MMDNPMKFVMMDEKGVSGSFMIIPKENRERLYPMILGAFSGPKVMPEPEIGSGGLVEQHALLGLGMGVGLLVCVVQRNSELVKKLENAEKEIMELKERRSEDAKANEKVVSIFAAREYRWCDERKKLRQQIGGLMNELRVVEKSKEESVSEFELVLQFKNKLMEELDKKLRASERLAEELREDVRSHKTEFIELECKQEAEMGRRQLEEAKQELESVLKHKEQLLLVNQWLFLDVVKMNKDLEQKDEMLKKSKFDTAEQHLDMRKGLQSKLMMGNPKNLGGCRLNNSEAGKHKIATDAFVEQLRQRDEKPASEAYHFQHRNSQSSLSSTWKMDNHALGVSYKVETLLKQQLFMLESRVGVKGSSFMPLMNKQLDHYQSLQRKIDHLCIRMHEDGLNSKRGMKEDDMQRMEHFLDQIFQLQRYIVATGQELVQVPEVGTSLVADAQDIGFEHSNESIKALFRQVQRGLEVRISRVLGDLERAMTLRKL